ncbi:hypothetical protein P0D73_44985 [Paraburkholderia sp. RL18-101-BIB-B]|uniref:hypothetical protein n=1 Tax=Paraburkholderia sp. RL18-101-BIB-B TaxID=3031634 RepID=UPI0038BCD065
MTITFVATLALNVNLALAQSCPSLSMDKCRATSEAGGKLLRQLTSGKDPHLVWLSPCGMSANKSDSRLDPLCQQIANCPASGAFGGFLSAVTGECRSKQFDGYFGLDGMTFGILDFTQDNFPDIVQAFRKRSQERFDQIFGKLGIPMKKGCVDAHWLCDANRQGNLTCDPKFYAVMREAVHDPIFKQAQIDIALKKYTQRLKKWASLGLKTEYGNVAMITVDNNLRDGPQCRPAAWKAACTGKSGGEAALVDCMLRKYMKGACRGNGKTEAAWNRGNAIMKRYEGRKDILMRPVSTEAIYACATK